MRPLLTLAGVTNLDVRKLSEMAGNQLPFLSCIVPLWLVWLMCGWRATREVLPAIAVAGGSFAVCQYGFAHSRAFPLTDIAGGLISLVVTAGFLHVWQPKRLWRFDTQDDPAETLATIKRMGVGATLTAWELDQQGISHQVIADNAAGYLMQRGEVDLVIVGSDRALGRSGEVANKIGTYGKAILAERHHVPFYVAIPLSTIDWNLSSGRDIPIEERDQSEVLGAWETSNQVYFAPVSKSSEASKAAIATAPRRMPCSRSPRP